MIRIPSSSGAARLATTILLGLAAVVTRSAHAQDRHAAWTAPAAAAERANPLGHRTDVEAGGRKLFRDRCASCHGENAQGTRKAPNLVASGVQAQSDGALFWKITQGNTRTGMPTFSFLPEPQRWQLVLHLRAIRDQR